VFFKSVLSNNASNSSLLKRAGHILCCIFKITVKTVICVIRLRQRKKDIARLHFARVDRKIRDFYRWQSGIEFRCPGLQIIDNSFQFQVFGFVFQIAGPLVSDLGVAVSAAVLSANGLLLSFFNGTSVFVLLFFSFGSDGVFSFSSGGPFTVGTSAGATSGTSTLVTAVDEAVRSCGTFAPSNNC